MSSGPLRPRDASTIDVLDRVLDKGIVISGRADVSIAGLQLVSIDGGAVVASIATYLRYQEAGVSVPGIGHEVEDFLRGTRDLGPLGM